MCDNNQTKKCSKCGEIKTRESFGKEKRVKEGLKSQCKKCDAIASYQYYQKREGEDPEFLKQRRETNAKWRKKNPKKIAEYRRVYKKKRYHNDYLFRLRCRIGCAIFKSFGNEGFKKNTRTHKILGCSYKEFAEHLQSQFQEGMTRENYGEWHIDHRLPVSAGKTEEEIVMLNHYTNLQPLWAKDNLEKKDKHCPEELKAYFAKRRTAMKEQV